ncbi:DotU family type IV/VI secretion system protein [Serratia marcescens]|uniref:DotU family type IV/VI secretion system protein n=1 Tax=Serratia marcescens TaxID=615 RepID=UPI0002B87E32|nr:DotU family type IV/VI secretion system protein [Serratia marcescens]EMF07038.1 DotU family type IV / VI secretion system protein [Serratia marcescens VGH107]
MELLDRYLPVFKQVLQMIGDPSQFDDYEQSRQTCICQLEQATYEAEHLDVSKEEKEAAQVAIIAWLDETVLRSSLSWRQRWQSELLQRKYLKITIAGEHFFTLLNQLEPCHKQARKVFLFCLQQGFQGQYNSPDDQPALQAVIDEQRNLCLPKMWQQWPNDAVIVPGLPAPAVTTTQRQRPLLSMTAGVALLYAVLYFILHHYVF